MALQVDGTLLFHSETGTEGGYWALQDARGLHYEVESCPWGRESLLSEGISACPGMRSYWERLGALEEDGHNYAPSPLMHATYYGLWILEDGDSLTVYDREDPTRVLYMGAVSLVHQRDQYAPDACSARGLVVHAVPVDQDLDSWSVLFFAEHPAVLSRSAPSPSDLEQDRRLRAKDF